MLNVDDVADAVGEIQRAARLGLAGAMIPLRPMDKRYDHPDYEPLWAAAQDLAMPLSLHVGTYRWGPGMHLANPSQDMVEFANREGDVRRAIAALIFGGVFERYPALKVLSPTPKNGMKLADQRSHFSFKMDSLHRLQAQCLHR